MRKPRQFSILRNGKIVGSYTVAVIKKMLRAGKLLKTDTFKSPISYKWIKLCSFKAVTKRLPRATRKKPEWSDEREFESAVNSDDGDVFVESQGIPRGLSVVAKYNFCLDCYSICHTAELLNLSVIACPECGSRKFWPYIPSKIKSNQPSSIDDSGVRFLVCDRCNRGYPFLMFPEFHGKTCPKCWDQLQDISRQWL